MERQEAASTDRTDRRGASDGAPARPPVSAAPAPFAGLIGRTRYTVLLAVAAVMLVAVSLFILGLGMAVVGVWAAVASAVRGELDSTRVTVELLEVVSVMLKAVVFYTVGIGLYSLFIAPLNLTSALGIETFYDLETKIVSIIIVIMGVTFLERFITWQQPAETFVYGVAMATVVAALVLFQFYSHRAREDQRRYAQPAQTRAQHELFERDSAERRVRPAEEPHPRGPEAT